MGKYLVGEEALHSCLVPREPKFMFTLSKTDIPINCYEFMQVIDLGNISNIFHRISNL